MLTIPTVADAADGDPEPTEYPTVAAPAQGGADRSDPEPTAAPTIARPDIGKALDPTPTDWPFPEPG